MKITKLRLAGMIDHSLLKPNATWEQLKKLCEEAISYGFKAVCVNPIHVAEAAQMLKGQKSSSVQWSGFPSAPIPIKQKPLRRKM